MSTEILNRPSGRLKREHKLHKFNPGTPPLYPRPRLPWIIYTVRTMYRSIFLYFCDIMWIYPSRNLAGFDTFAWSNHRVGTTICVRVASFSIAFDIGSALQQIPIQTISDFWIGTALIQSSKPSLFSFQDVLTSFTLKSPCLNCVYSGGRVLSRIVRACTRTSSFRATACQVLHSRLVYLLYLLALFTFIEIRMSGAFCSLRTQYRKVLRCRCDDGNALYRLFRPILSSKLYLTYTSSMLVLSVNYLSLTMLFSFRRFDKFR